jgi:indolepyruvate ferredoxin oxidoreductase alpha subunit
MEADPFDLKGFAEVVQEGLLAEEPWVVISKAPCALEYKVKGEPYQVEVDKCTGCRRCLEAACAALSFQKGVGRRGRGLAAIDPTTCTGCGVCAQLCRPDAIRAPYTG